MLDRHLWRDFVAVTSSVAVLGIGVGSTLPLTALLLTSRGSGPEVVGWMTAAVAAGGVIGTFSAPPATLRFGRKRVMLICVILAALSVVSLQFFDSLWVWAILRAAFGAAMAPLFVIGEAWINSLPGDASRGRVVAIYTTSFTLCQVVGPLLTDILTRVPQQAFLICGAVFLLGIPGVASARDAAPARGAAPATRRANLRSPDSVIPGDNAVPGDNVAIAEKDSAASWWAIVRMAPTIVAGAGLFAAFDNIILSFLPLFALDHGLTQSRALTAVVAVFAGDAALQFLAGWLADYFGYERVHRAAGISMCILLPLLPLAVQFPGLWELYLFMLGGVAGSIYTLSMVSSGERFSGGALLRASGLIALTWSLASGVGPAATGMVVQHFGGNAMPAVLWIMALGFLIATRRRGAQLP